MCLNQLKSSTVFPRKNALAFISNFSYKDGRLVEGEHLIEGALFKRTRERSNCFWEVYCIQQKRGNRTKIKRREITHKKELWNYLPLLILLQSKLKKFKIKWQWKLVFHVSLLFKNVRGKGGKPLFERGQLIDIWPWGWLLFERGRLYIRAWTFIRGNTVYSKTQGKADLCQSFDVYIRSTIIKVRPHPGQSNSQKIRIPSSSGYRCNFGSVNDIRKQGHHLEQFLHRLTSSCCLKGIQDGLNSGFHGDGLRILCSMDLVFRIPIVSSIPESLSCILDSRTQDFGLYEQRFSEFYQCYILSTFLRANRLEMPD